MLLCEHNARTDEVRADFALPADQTNGFPLQGARLSLGVPLLALSFAPGEPVFRPVDQRQIIGKERLTDRSGRASLKAGCTS